MKLPVTANPARVVLTGASRGIGKAVLLSLVRDGHYVVGLSRTKPQELENPGRTILAADHVTWRSLDLSNPSEVESCAASFAETQIRALILCAVDYGSTGRHPAATTFAAEWQRVITTNCMSQCILASHLLPRLTAHSPGIIVNVSSDVALLPGPGRIAYSASKAGLHAALRTIAQEHSEECLHVYQLVPTFQLLTSGIRRRRPPDFDFSSYADPDVIAQIVSKILTGSGSTLAPGTYLIRRDGTLDAYSEKAHL